MDLAYLNYLQNNSSQANSMPNEDNQENYNPFNLGIKRAMESARESLGMTEKQQDKSMRRALLAFGNRMSQEPVQKGFLNNVGAISRSLSPAIEAYDNNEDLSFKDNNNLANQILAYQNAERANEDRMEEKTWRRQHLENQLAEQQRYHDMINERRNIGSMGGIGNLTDTSSLGQEFMPIQTKNELIAYSKDKKSLGTILHEINELQSSYDKFRNDYSDNVIDPMSPLASITNPAKDILGKFGYMKKLRQETADRKTLASKLNKFVISSERALKGGGVMGPTLIKMFEQQGIYPNLDHDTPEIFESKLKMLKEEIENSYKAANLSLNYGVKIDPSQVPTIESQMKGENTPLQENISSNELIMMRNEQGDMFQIPANEVENAINDGLMLIEGE